MAKKNKLRKNVLKKMKNDYLHYLETPIEQYDGQIRPPVQHASKWRDIESSTLNGGFVNISDLINEKDKNVWIWSDQHFNHSNVIKHGKRPFNDVEEMNAFLIDSYLDVVKEGDICIWAGDIFFKSKTVFKESILPLLNKTYNILVVGNHDFQSQKIKDMGFDEVHLLLDFEYKNNRCVVSHFPFVVSDEEFINVHGHIHQHKSEYPHQINVSVEVLEFQPVLINHLLDDFITSSDIFEI